MATFGIRPFKSEDVEELYAAVWESREHVGKWMDWVTEDYSREHASNWVKHAIGSWERGEAYEHVIFDTADYSIAGCCGLNRLNRTDLVCNLGYWVRSSRLGEGAASQAAVLLAEFGFQTLRFNRLEIVVAEGNLFSRRAAERAGASYEGRQRLRVRVRRIALDGHMYALTNEAAAHGAPPDRDELED
jgi:RimJ/RimL family protein N-acetyltransferase